jgi:hypothetical protein
MSTFFGKKRRATEAETEEAVDAVRKRIVRTAYEAERKYGVSKLAIRRHNGGSQLPRQAHEDKELLSKNKEGSLGLWCEEYTRAGCPLPPSAMRDMAGR